LRTIKADPGSQLRLLDLQATDTALAQLNHRRRTLPQISTPERRRLAAMRPSAARNASVPISASASSGRIGACAPAPAGWTRRSRSHSGSSAGTRARKPAASARAIA